MNYLTIIGGDGFILGLCILAIGIVIACVIDLDAGAFECQECKTRFIPIMKDYVMGHLLSTEENSVLLALCPVA